MRRPDSEAWWQEQAENLVALRQGMEEATRRLVLRYHQAGRRARGHPDILNVLVPMAEELTDITCALSEMSCICATLIQECERRMLAE